MAKGPTITTIASGYYSRTALNDNFTNIDTAFDNTLSLDGSTPNAMTGDIDLGTNDLLNVGTINGADATALSADLTTIAGIGADITTVAGISADVTTVAADATDIGLVAGVAANVTTVAGISSDVTTVAADATDIGLVAGISTDVTTVATNLADVTNFSDVYLGPKASDPTTRNDASALVAGDLYFNTASDDMFVYSGSAWEAAYVSLSGAALTANNLSDLGNAATALTNLGVTSTAAELNILDGVTASTAEVNHLVGVTSPVQTQLDAKSTASATETLTNKTLTAPIINGAVTGDSLSTQVEAEAGTNNDQLMTPLRTAQAIGALTAAEVITTTAGLAVGAVGSYAYLQHVTADLKFNAGVTYAGSDLRYSGTLSSSGTTSNGHYMHEGTTAASGTWRAMGAAQNYFSTKYPATLFLRIS